VFTPLKLKVKFAVTTFEELTTTMRTELNAASDANSGLIAEPLSDADGAVCRIPAL